MRVAISAQGSDMDALVDPRFGRARWIIVADVGTGDWTAHDNAANVDASGGAGVQVGTAVASEGVAAVITGNVGPNAHKTLTAAGITIHQADNGVTVRDALSAFVGGALPPVQAPTMGGHWS